MLAPYNIPISISIQLTVETLTNALSYFEKGMNFLLQHDPNEERSGQTSREVNSAIDCYKALRKEANKRAKQLNYYEYIHILSQSSKKKINENSKPITILDLGEFMEKSGSSVSPLDYTISISSVWRHSE